MTQVSKKLTLDPMRRAALRALLASAPQTAAPEPEPKLRNYAGGVRVRLSFCQQRLWFLDRLQPNSSLYNMYAPVTFKGALDETALRRALNEIVRRHESLRTAFPDAYGEPCQVVMPAGPVDLPLTDLRALPAEDRQGRCQAVLSSVAFEPYDLSRGPLFRCHLVRLDEAEYVLMLAMHHIVADGWSLRVLMSELQALYAAFAANRAPDLPEPALQYRDFSEWQHETLQGERRARLLLFWRAQLADAPTRLELPTDFAPPPQPTFNGDLRRLRLSPELSQAIGRLGRRHGATPFMVLLAAFGVLLGRSAQQTDVLIGSPIANRTRKELENLVGFFANTLVLRIDLGGDPSFLDLLASTRSTALAAFEHQDVPFELLVAELQPERNLSHNPLFQVLFSLNRRLSGGGEKDQRRGADIVAGTSKFDIGLFVDDDADVYTLVLEYSTDLFSATRTDAMLARMRLILEAVTEDPEVRVSQIPLSDPDETRRLLGDWSASPDLADPPPTGPLTRFEAVSADHPEWTALQIGDLRVSYGELDLMAGRFARYLADQCVQRGDRVCLLLDRSIAFIASMIAVMKLGACYVPISIEDPPGLIRQKIDAAQARAVVISDAFKLRLGKGVRRIPLSRVQTALQDAALEPVAGRRPAPDDAVYLLYTSGSTGAPKGVLMRHLPLARLIDWQIRTSALGPKETTIHASALSFDVCFQEVFATLAAGGALVMVSENDRRDPYRLLEILERERVARVFLPFIALSLLAEALARRPGVRLSLREVITAGEALTVTSDLRNMFQRLAGCRLKNQYGPTESHVVAEHVLPPDVQAWPTRPPIGVPVAGARLYVLDAALLPTPTGDWGELYIGGEATALGYAGQARLTAKGFVPDPFGESPSARMYRTGDLVRWTAEGLLEFNGRLDDQIKLRGFRIEPGEVECALSAHPSVKQAAVAVKGDDAARRQLVGYLIRQEGKPEPDEATLRAHLARRLPAHMIPDRFVFLRELPVTRTGKLDRRRLPEPKHSSAQDRSELVPPRTLFEEVVVDAFRSVLGRKDIGIRDHFFALGGHSLLAVRVVAFIEEALGVQVPVRRIFESPIPEQLALVIAGLMLDALPQDEANALLAEAGADGDADQQNTRAEEVPS